MRVAVVIVSWNSRDHLPRALEALAGQTHPPARTIVVDNASSDGSAELVRERFPDVEAIDSGSNLGFAAANNVGVAAARDCELIALLNPDAFPEPDWLAALVRAAEEHPGHGFFGSRLMRDHDPEEIDGSGDLYHVSGLVLRRHHGLRLGSTPAALEPDETFSVCAGAALYRRAAFDEVGGFDASFGSYVEDADLAFRLRLAGHRGLYVPDSVVRHVGSVSAGVEGEYLVYHSARNLIWTWAKNMPWPLVLLYLPQHLALNVATAAWFALRGRARAQLRGQRDALRGLPAVLRRRRRIQSARRAPARELRALMTRGAGGRADVLRRVRHRRSG